PPAPEAPPTVLRRVDCPDLVTAPALGRRGSRFRARIEQVAGPGSPGPASAPRVVRRRSATDHRHGRSLPIGLLNRRFRLSVHPYLALTANPPRYRGPGLPESASGPF